MQMIAPQSIAITATVTKDEIRQRMAFEVMEQISALGPDGKPLPGVKWTVTRGNGRAGGYSISVTGPMPARALLPNPMQGRE